MSENNSGFTQPKKIKHLALWIVLPILAVVVCVIVCLVCYVLGMFVPKNLDIKYSETDYSGALDKIGMDVTLDGQTDEQLAESLRQLRERGETLDNDNYSMEFSSFVRKKFTLNSTEATALANEIVPVLFWLNDIQIKINKNKTVCISATLQFKRLVNKLAPSFDNDFILSLYDEADLYYKGNFSITDNYLSLQPDKFESNPVLKIIFNEILSEKSIDLSHLYINSASLKIYSLTVNDNAEFEADALIPQKLVITKK